VGVRETATEYGNTFQQVHTSPLPFLLSLSLWIYMQYFANSNEYTEAAWLNNPVHLAISMCTSNCCTHK
jgi:hypothetical protein